jgi:hypothetical protein
MQLGHLKLGAAFKETSHEVVAKEPVATLFGLVGELITTPRGQNG